MNINGISSFPPSQTFANLFIDELNIEDTTIETLPAHLFDGILTLSTLSLSNFYTLKRIEPNCLSRIEANLTSLVINGEYFNTSAVGFESELSNLKHLKQLNIFSDQGKNLSLASIPWSPSLEDIFLHRFDVIDVNSTYFPTNNNLDYLGLVNSNIRYIGVDTFRSLKKLTNIDLYGNQIEDISFLKPLTSIQFKQLI